MRYLVFIFPMVFATLIAAAVSAQMYDYQNAEGNMHVAENHRNTDANLVIKGEALRREQAKLQEEYECIMEAKADIEELPAADVSDEEFDAYVQKVDEINKRIEDYEEKLKDLEIRVKKYNARFEE